MNGSLVKKKISEQIKITNESFNLSDIIDDLDKIDDKS